MLHRQNEGIEPNDHLHDNITTYWSKLLSLSFQRQPGSKHIPEILYLDCFRLSICVHGKWINKVLYSNISIVRTLNRAQIWWVTCSLSTRNVPLSKLIHSALWKNKGQWSSPMVITPKSEPALQYFSTTPLQGRASPSQFRPHPLQFNSNDRFNLSWGASTFC